MGKVDVYIYIFLTSTLVGGDWSASRPCRFTPGEKAFGTHWIGGLVDPRAGLHDVENRKFLILPGLELGTLGRPLASHYSDWATQALCLRKYSALETPGAHNMIRRNTDTTTCSTGNKPDTGLKLVFAHMTIVTPLWAYPPTGRVIPNLNHCLKPSIGAKYCHNLTQHNYSFIVYWDIRHLKFSW
jgi:hypothetical protein